MKRGTGVGQEAGWEEKKGKKGKKRKGDTVCGGPWEEGSSSEELDGDGKVEIVHGPDFYS